MHLLNRLIPWRTDMPDQPDDITRLRKSHYALDELPETVSFLKHPSEPAREPPLRDSGFSNPFIAPQWECPQTMMS